MVSSPRSIPFGLAALAVLMLCGVVRFFPPDGREHPDFAQFLGTFHLLVIHFPIAFLLLALLFDVVTLGEKRASLPLRHSTDFVLALATLAVITSAWLGWLLAWSGGYQGDLVRNHMWSGTSLAMASLVCLWSFSWNRRFAMAALIATIGLMT